MLIKQMCQKICIFTLAWLMCAPALANHARNGLGQTIQIYSQLEDIIGKPAWLIIIRNVDTGAVTPYLYDFYDRQNFWPIFTLASNYTITVSQLTFDPYNVTINNFCELQSQFFKDVSLAITIQGRLTPDPRTFSCHVLKYPSTTFTITEQGPSDS